MSHLDRTAVSSKHHSTVLIADDERLMRDLLASILKGCGYRHFLFAADGQQALELMRQEGPALGLAFLDIHMPGFSGIELLALAKHCCPACDCVIVSADSAIETVMASLDGGAAGFVVKPYTPKKITDVLSKYTRGTQP
ncbi:response regulator [Massilia violaceinigra]|uniref:Response regulator n=1 Tax=Massilia violaceinigra TaxID=2045208 RepID=A0ABY4A8F0_9BURK|nr:response regulator [Massilia violaceinigra]UOD31060.1 response regulator [Massilia violaceinigra]